MMSKRKKYGLRRGRGTTIMIVLVFLLAVSVIAITSVMLAVNSRTLAYNGRDMAIAEYAAYAAQAYAVNQITSQEDYIIPHLWGINDYGDVDRELGFTGSDLDPAERMARADRRWFFVEDPSRGVYELPMNPNDTSTFQSALNDNLHIKNTPGAEKKIARMYIWTKYRWWTCFDEDGAVNTVTDAYGLERTVPYMMNDGNTWSIYTYAVYNDFVSAYRTDVLLDIRAFDFDLFGDTYIFLDNESTEAGEDGNPTRYENAYPYNDPNVDPATPASDWEYEYFAKASNLDVNSMGCLLPEDYSEVSMCGLQSIWSNGELDTSDLVVINCEKYAEEEKEAVERLPKPFVAALGHASIGGKLNGHLYASTCNTRGPDGKQEVDQIASHWGGGAVNDWTGSEMRFQHPVINPGLYTASAPWRNLYVADRGTNRPVHLRHGMKFREMQDPYNQTTLDDCDRYFDAVTGYPEAIDAYIYAGSRGTPGIPPPLGVTGYLKTSPLTGTNFAAKNGPHWYVARAENAPGTGGNWITIPDSRFEIPFPYYNPLKRHAEFNPGGLGLPNIGPWPPMAPGGAFSATRNLRPIFQLPNPHAPDGDPTEQNPNGWFLGEIEFPRYDWVSAKEYAEAKGTYFRHWYEFSDWINGLLPDPNNLRTTEPFGGGTRITIGDRENPIIFYIGGGSWGCWNLAHNITHFRVYGAIVTDGGLDISDPHSDHFRMTVDSTIEVSPSPAGAPSTRYHLVPSFDPRIDSDVIGLNPVCPGVCSAGQSGRSCGWDSFGESRCTFIPNTPAAGDRLIDGAPYGEPNFYYVADRDGCRELEITAIQKGRYYLPAIVARRGVVIRNRSYKTVIRGLIYTCGDKYHAKPYGAAGNKNFTAPAFDWFTRNGHEMETGRIHIDTRQIWNSGGPKVQYSYNGRVEIYGAQVARCIYNRGFINYSYDPDVKLTLGFYVKYPWDVAIQSVQEISDFE